MKRLVVIGAHAFDAEAMAGGLAARWVREGGKVELLHLTRGERGDPTREQEEYGKQIEEELAASARYLGATGRWMGFSSGSLEAGSVIEALVAYLDRFRPALVVTHWRGSWHPRHRQAHELVREAIGRYQRRAGQVPVLWYGENFEDLDGFRPDVYVGLNELDVELWRAGREAYSLYRGRQGRGPGGAPAVLPYASYYEAAPLVRGLECGVPLAQAFMQEPVRYDLDSPLTGSKSLSKV
ncbi:PIG-L deacetylase family protein [Limnochorda pilosa]|uniref:LmbE family protein n=1 Tax=Limnochorda pilosa TaxID=1555112 RepID=A0A0K2SH11_LIMPI|nr:PIG-L family deacetylase [Limnochorda pilosa]BAS26375.1 LmbE family protein [Limnochorda pilosa]